MAPAETCRLLVNGEWVASDARGTTPVYNPSEGVQIASTPLCGAEEVDGAVLAAEAAAPAWADTPPIDRARVMFRLRELMDAHTEDIAQTITREHGKTLAEARGEVLRGLEVVEFACGAPALLMGESLENIARGIDCDGVRRPLGVCGSISPFNFPFMVPLWSLPIALVCGNCYVLKPSEKVPLSAIRLGELLVEAGLPAGVFSIVHGGADAVDALLTHPVVKAITFVGSTHVAKHVYETGTRHGKRVQSSGGAKNYMVVMPDADVESTIAGVMGSAFGCAGERCMAGSVLVCVGEAADTFLPRFLEAVRDVRVGPTDRDPDAQMGPVISPQHLERMHHYVTSGVDDGAELVIDGRGASVPACPHGFYIGPTVFDRVTPDMAIAREEIFGPVLSVMRTDTLETAAEFSNQSGFGNAAVIFTESGAAARTLRHSANAGMIGVNIGVPAPMAFFPFSGWNNSFYGDLHVQGRECVGFFTRQQVTISRWAESKKMFF